MGVAEIIPGVSGGTLAFITGIYNELINSIKSINFESVSFLTKLELRKFWKHINGNFLITLVLGMITSILLFSRIISFLLTNYNFQIWGFFFGLIIGVPACCWSLGKVILSSPLGESFYILNKLVVNFQLFDKLLAP